jgi:hypothetical protein
MGSQYGTVPFCLSDIVKKLCAIMPQDNMAGLGPFPRQREVTNLFDTKPKRPLQELSKHLPFKGLQRRRDQKPIRCRCTYFVFMCTHLSDKDG